MANHASALKRIRQNKKKNLINTAHKSACKTSIKKTLKYIAENNKVEAEKSLKVAISKLDKASIKGTYHKNNAGRKISRLTRKFNTMEAS